ncbi:hypothetical protein DLD82_17555 [Methanospirillum stamsii]|uniref:Uncharacterized protein n=1 Tax=Methanospirillum stamsii TaxID=1277351 RepID=A0A2V2MTD2_9EURY|nr:hypothetical protein DLD82_17555 [Methanospirillum stamsii]
MSEKKDICEDLQPSYRDYTHAGVKAGLSFIPVIGGPISAFFSDKGIVTTLSRQLHVSNFFTLFPLMYKYQRKFYFEHHFLLHPIHLFITFDLKLERDLAAVKSQMEICSWLLD